MKAQTPLKALVLNKLYTYPKIWARDSNILVPLCR